MLVRESLLEECDFQGIENSDKIGNSLTCFDHILRFFVKVVIVTIAIKIIVVVTIAIFVILIQISLADRKK